MKILCKNKWQNRLLFKLNIEIGFIFRVLFKILFWKQKKPYWFTCGIYKRLMKYVMYTFSTAAIKKGNDEILFQPFSKVIFSG